jgi:hypothetical protein
MANTKAQTAGHTPGPWVFGLNGVGRGIIHDQSPLCRHIAYLSDGGVPQTEEDANARLIAAAPTRERESYLDWLTAKVRGRKGSIAERFRNAARELRGQWSTT